MTVSVVLSTYNGVEYLKELLDSIRLQTRQPDKVLISDDCSTDNTCEFVGEYIRQYDLDWELIQHNKNVGWRINFRRTMLDASSDVIFLCDQDDIWYKSKIKDMTSVMEQYQEIDVLTSSWEVMSEDKENGQIKPVQETGAVSKVQFKENIFRIPYPGCTYCVRSTFAHEAAEFWRDSFPHDAFIWRMANLKGTLYTYDKAEMKWRRHSDSSFAKEKKSSHSSNSRLEWLDYASESVESLRQYAEKLNVSDISEVRNVIQRNQTCLKLRKELYTNKSVLSWIKLSRYVGNYPYREQYFSDIVYATRGEL